MLPMVIRIRPALLRSMVPAQKGSHMENRAARNRRFLADLFAGPFPGHAIIMDAEEEPPGFPGDVSCHKGPVTDWLDWSLKGYEAEVKLLNEVEHDGVPCGKVRTGTGVFAAAFGCPIHVYSDSPACALPIVTDLVASEAHRL
jgi:hypothetical protein